MRKPPDLARVLRTQRERRAEKENALTGSRQTIPMNASQEKVNRAVTRSRAQLTQQKGWWAY